MGEFMQPAKLDLDTKRAGDTEVAVVGLNGMLSLETVNKFLEAMRPEAPAHLVLDMSGVSYLDSAGVGALVGLYVSRRNRGKTLALAALTRQGTAILQVAGLMKLMPVFPSVDEALSKRA